MIWLIRQHDDHVAAAETEQAASRLEAQGYQRCEYAVYLAAWRRQDERRVERLRIEVERTAESTATQLELPPPAVKRPRKGERGE